ncbi:MAG: type II-A CRISPR-associated protein Csn2 [Clostridia bacterium]|nr:type II-A CRISPR-associated protein Csn2 [Clostridia bacterium]
MNVSFSFLSAPLNLNPNNPCILCIENRVLLRDVITAFFNERTLEEGICFWQDETELKFKGNICFVGNIFELKTPASVLKKMHENLARFCNSEMLNETLNLKTVILNYLDILVRNYDYDFEYSVDVSPIDLFKMQDLRPLLTNEDFPQSLLSYLLFLRQYAGIKCFVIAHLHSYFTSEELERFYKEIAYRDICLFLLESEQNFEPLPCERVSIVDSDLCEILAN